MLNFVFIHRASIGYNFFIVQVDVENDADRTVQADASQESQHGGQLHPVSNSSSSLFFSRFLLMSANAHPRDGSFR
jgi:hypothetical protein